MAVGEGGSRKRWEEEEVGRGGGGVVSIAAGATAPLVGPSAQPSVTLSKQGAR